VNVETTPETPVEPPASGRLRSRLRLAFSGSRELVRIAYRDPEHVSERLTLYASQSLAEPAREWAETIRATRPEATSAELAEEQRVQSAKIARVDGAVAGTPFFIALAPAYASYLWQEARMALRIASLYGRDPASLDTAAEVLALRGVHPTIEAAKASLVKVEARPAPVPARRPLRTWWNSVRALLIFGGFMSAPEDQGESRSRLRAVAGFMLAGAIWLTTWVVPVTFMIVMAWGCEVHARQLGQRTLTFYEGRASTSRAAIAAAARVTDTGHRRRQLIRSAALGLSVAIPIGFVAYANHVRQSTGVNWIGALAALVALSLVIAASIVGSRR
jgi:hypothetical protein